MRRRPIAGRAIICAAAIASALALKAPLVENVFAQEKQQSAKTKLSHKEKKKMVKDFEKAVKTGDIERAVELLGQGKEAIKEKEKTAALFIASKKGNVDMVRLLVEEGADVNAFDMNSYKTRETGWTALVYAAVNDRMDVVKYFVEELKIDVDQRDALGCTPLMNTAYFRKSDYEKNYEMIDYLISKGADVNAVSDNGTTAFMGTAIEARMEVAMMLVQNGARPDARTTSYGDTAIYRAAERDRYAFVELLLSLGVDINVQDDFGVTPLMKASGNGSINSVRVLVAKAADVNMQDYDGRNALMYAVRAVDLKVDEMPAEKLEAMGETEKNHYELKKQYRRESIEIIEILLSSPHMDLKIKDKSGKTALGHADDPEVRKLLKKHGAK